MASFSNDEIGWENVTVERPSQEVDKPNLVRFLKHTNDLVQVGYWLTSDDVECVFRLWKQWLEVGDRLVVKSTKNRGSSVQGTPDCIWSMEVIEE